ncbi:MAG: sensor histidine kinase [Myxococcales bacterium]|nr:sensor histidine kinase [Myxococcales bacterium]
MRAVIPVSLRDYLGARMRPLVVLLLALVAISAPLADYVLTLRVLRQSAAATANEVATVIDREVQERPVLWRYDSLKLLTHVRTFAMRSDIARIEVLDRDGARIDLGGERPGDDMGRLLWESAPLVINGETVGHVWVAARASRAAADALFLLIPFGLLGVCLAGLIYWLPLRAMDVAERRIGGLITRLREREDELARFNQTLEQQVAARSQELRAAYDELQEKEIRLREVSSRAIALQEAERRGIARELHDSAGQAITAIRINLQLIAQGVGDMDWVRSLGEKTLTLTDQTLEEIRRAVVTLGPAILDDFGLEVAVRRYCADFEDRTPETVVRCEIELPASGLSPALESACYRLVQEALTNIARHAEAHEVCVSLRVTGDGEARALVLEIEDDGCGFDAEAARRDARRRPPGQGGRGLAGMRERVELLGGALELETAPGDGTRLRATLPCMVETRADDENDHERDEFDEDGEDDEDDEGEGDEAEVEGDDDRADGHDATAAPRGSA